MHKKYVLKSPEKLVAVVAVIFLLILAVVFLPPSNIETISYSNMQVYNIISGYGGNPLQKPSAVAVGLNGEVIVADSGSKRMMVFAENGEHLFNFSGPGTGLAEIENPTAIAVAPTGYIYVTDRDKQAVIVFSNKGEYRYRITKKEDFIPTGVVVGNDGIPYIFNEADKNVYTYDFEKKELKSILESSKLNLCGDMCWDPDDNRILTIDIKQKQIAVIKNDKVKDTWGQKYLEAPSGITYDRSNKYVFVSDSIKSHIVVFDSDGEYIGTFGTNGEGKTNFNFPEGLAMDQRGKLYIADKGNNRVVIYQFK